MPPWSTGRRRGASGGAPIVAEGLIACRTLGSHPQALHVRYVEIIPDDDVLDWFRDRADAAGGGNYQTMINAALRDFIERSAEPLEETLRRVVREELDRSA